MEETCEVEKIIGRRICLAKKTEYLVFWRGYGVNECQWVPSTDMECDQAVVQFERECFNLRKAWRLGHAVPSIDRFENEGIATLVDKAHEIYAGDISPFEDVTGDFRFKGSGHGPVEPPLAPGARRAAAGQKQRSWQVATHGWGRVPGEASGARISRIRGLISDPSGKVYYIVEWSDGASSWERPSAFGDARAALHEYEGQRYERERKELVERFQQSKIKADASIVQPREPKSMIEKSSMRPGRVPVQRISAPAQAARDLPGTAIMRSPLPAGAPAREWFNIGTSKLLGVDSMPGASDSDIPLMAATLAAAAISRSADSDAGSDASSDSNASDFPLIKSTLSNRATRRVRDPAYDQSSSSDTDSSDTPLALVLLGARAGGTSSRLRRRPWDNQAARRPVAYVYIDHAEGEVVGGYKTAARAPDTDLVLASVPSSPELDQLSLHQTRRAAESSDDSRVDGITKRQCSYCSVDAALPVGGNVRQLHCTACGLSYHSACYRQLAARFDSVDADADNTAAAAGDFVCRFCNEYGERGAELYLTWRTACTPQLAEGDALALGHVDVIVKWRDVSYRHLAWVPLVWLSSTRRSPLLRGIKARILAGESPPSLESKVDSNYYLPAYIIGVQPARISLIARRQQRLEGSATDIPSDKWVLYTSYEKVWVVWQGLDMSEATWEVPPDPLTETAAYLSWYDAFVAWRNAEMVSLNRQRGLLLGERGDRRIVDFKQQPHFVEGGQLKDYQLEGANWLWRHWKEGNSAILADEMGMGKTIQLIAFLLMVYHSTVPDRYKGADVTASNTGVFPFLVVVPTTLVANWAREFSTWAPSLVVAQLSGQAANRDLQLEHTLFHKSGAGKRDLRCHVVLTSYEAISSAAGSAAMLAANIHWQVVVVDEGHRLKNDQTKTHQALLKFRTRQRVVLTGTPLQNHLRELFCIMAFIDEAHFGNADALAARFDANKASDIAAVKDLLRPYILRRTKKEHLSLMPPKFEVILPVSMTKLQRELYKATLARNVPLLRKISAVLNTGGGDAQPDSESAEGDVETRRGARQRTAPPAVAPRPKKPVMLSLNNLLMEVRRIVSHPYLVRNVEPEFPSEAEKHRRLIDSSGKLSLVHQLLPELKARGHRVLLFAQFKDTLDIFEDYLSGEGIGYERIDGDTPQQLRQVRVSAFNAPRSPALVFLSSTRTGGLGLNLTSADTVIIYDCDFNPQVDIQAMARAHRIGQTKPVSVFKLVTSDSAEERIVAMATRKLVLDHLVIQSMDSPVAPADEEAQPGDIEQALRHGASQLFGADSEERAQATSIKYDRARIVALLDEFQRELDAEVERAASTAKRAADPAKNQASDFARVWTLDKDGSVSSVVVDPEASATGDAEDPDVWDRLLELAADSTGASAGGLDPTSEEVGGRMLRTRKRRVVYADDGNDRRSSLRVDADRDYVDAGGEGVDLDDEDSSVSDSSDLAVTNGASDGPGTSATAEPCAVVRVSQPTLISVVCMHWKQLVARYSSTDSAGYQPTEAQGQEIVKLFDEVRRLQTPLQGDIPGDGSPPLFFPVPTNMRLRQGSQLPVQPINKDCPVCSGTKHERSYCPFIHDPRLIEAITRVQQMNNYWQHPHYHNFVVWYTVQYLWFVLSHVEGERVNADNCRRYPEYALDATPYITAVKRVRLERSQNMHKRRRLQEQARMLTALNADARRAASDDIFADGGGSSADDLYSTPDAAIVPPTRSFALSPSTGNEYSWFFASLCQLCSIAAPRTEGSIAAMKQSLATLCQLRNDTLGSARANLRKKLPSAERLGFADVHRQTVGLRFIEMRITQLRNSISHGTALAQNGLPAQPAQPVRLMQPMQPAQPVRLMQPMQPAQPAQPTRAVPVQPTRLDKPGPSKPQPKEAPKVADPLATTASFIQEYVRKLSSLKSELGKAQPGNGIAQLRMLCTLMEHSRDCSLAVLASMCTNSASLQTLLQPAEKLMNERAKMPADASPDAQKKASRDINQAIIRIHATISDRVRQFASATPSVQGPLAKPTPTPTPPPVSRASPAPVRLGGTPTPLASVRNPVVPMVSSPLALPDATVQLWPRPTAVAAGSRPSVHNPPYHPPHHPHMPLSALAGPMPDMPISTASVPRSLSAQHLPSGVWGQHPVVSQAPMPQLPSSQVPALVPAMEIVTPGAASAEAVTMVAPQYIKALTRMPQGANGMPPHPQQAMLFQGHSAFSSGYSSPASTPGSLAGGASTSSAMGPAAVYYPHLGGHVMGMVARPSPQLGPSTTYDIACSLCNRSDHQPSRCPARADVNQLTSRRVAVSMNQELPPGIKEMTLATIDHYLQLYYKSM